MPGHDDRLNAEEAAAVARLHAERLAAKEAAERAERERLAETTAPEDLAAMLGASPEEIRALADEVRRRPSWITEPGAEVRRADARGRRALMLAAFALTIILVAAITWHLTWRPRFVSPPANFGYDRQVRDPVWDPYAEAYKRDPFQTYGPPVVTILSPNVVPAPPGFLIRVKTPYTTYVAAGAPAGSGTLAPAESTRRLRAAVRSLAHHVESLATVRGRVPYLVFPGKVPWTSGTESFSGRGFNNGAEFIGWHTIEVENADGKAMISLVPDRRYVRPQDTAGYEREMNSRLDWILDNKTVPGAASSMRKDAKLVRLKTTFPKGVALCAIGSGGKYVAEGEGPTWEAGPRTERALREIVLMAYRAGGRKDSAVRAIADAPGESYDIPLAPHELGEGPVPPTPPGRSAIGPGVRLAWVRETVERAFARPNAGVTEITHGGVANRR